MRLLKLITYPNEILRKNCVDVIPNKHLQDIQKLIDKMFKTMRFYEGVGLSAPQIGVSFNVVVIDLQDGTTEPLSLINPKIIKFEGKTESLEECLSFPGIKCYVPRSSKIEVNFLDYNGLEKTLSQFSLVHKDYPHKVLLKYNSIESDFSNKEVEECRGLVLKKYTWEVMSLEITA